MKTKEKLIDVVKASKVIYFVYFYSASFLINMLKLFVKPDDKLILFVSYGGRYFNDSPRTLYEAMQADKRFDGFRYVWAFRDPNAFPEVPERVKIDSLKYFITALKARCWITNVHIERGLDFKGKRTFYFNTTHTLLPKVTGKALINTDETFTTKAKSKCDCYSVQCEFEREIYGSRKDKVKVIGYPKSDAIANYTEEERLQLRKKYNLPEGKTVILYAPTFREDSPSQMNSPIDFQKWERLLGKDYIVLFRAHPVVANNTKIDSSSGFVFDASSYTNNNELIIASDILISDYSGIFFEFGIQDKPMFCFAYDYEEYIKVRALYFDIRDELPGGHMTEEELLGYIKTGNREEIMKKVREFRSKYITAYGNATPQSLDIIYQNIKA